MTRSLRRRKSRPSYADTELDDDDDNEDRRDPGVAGPSNMTVLEGSSALNTLVPHVHPGGSQQSLLAMPIDSGPAVVGSSVQPERNIKGKGKDKQSDGGASRLSRPPNRQNYVLPTPSVHHRHRAVALFTRTARVERLETPPQLFGPAKTTSTNNFTYNTTITDRVNKAWGYNAGPGPLWELVEDRGWYKEGFSEKCEVEQEIYRRPRVYQHVSLKQGWTVLNVEEASPYLPVSTDEGRLKPAPPVTCSFGPFGQQTQVKMKMFDTRKMTEFIPESKAHVFSAGGPVWGLDWCPIHPDDRPSREYTQYLAVAPFPSSSYSPGIGHKVLRPSRACIQIWTLRPSGEIDTGEMECGMVLCLEGGPAHEIKWCPLPSHDIMSQPLTSMQPRKLGLIAGTFEDGSLSIYAVPEPRDVIPLCHDASHPAFVRIPHPLVRIELEETACWSLDWANSEVLAVGTTSGIIAVYNIAEALNMTSSSVDVVTNVLPTHYITVHQSAIRALAWIRAPPSSPGESYANFDPTVIASGGYDGVECLTDVREGSGCVMNRTRDVINAMTFSPFAGGPITIDHENMVKAYSASASMLGRGHLLLEPQGPVWSVDASDYHPQLAVGCSDGSCSTTNSLRSTRRGGSVPFFVHKIYQLDYSRHDGEYRMLERFLPHETQDKGTSATSKSKIKEQEKNGNDLSGASTGAWSQQVGIHRVTWNDGNGLVASGMLASGTASGLCRVDWLWGRWMKGKIPYGSVVNVRKETDADGMEVNSSQSDGE